MPEKEVPRGYMRKELRACRGHVDMPDSWFFNHAPGIAGHTFYLTRENLKKRGYFKTGVTIMFAPGAALKELEAHSAEVADILDQATEAYRSSFDISTEEPKRTEDEHFSHIILDMVGKTNKAQSLAAFGEVGAVNVVNIPSVSLRTKISINNKTGSMYVASFEAPTDKWEESEIVGQTILDSLQYEPTV